ncbi:formiminoglutamase [Pustulibacterium marinum]|uniref:Formiminoglutamase n=1 Tax=Pustulibacterium marinum TaxID=1224947 RepID=A0A1I7GCI5_9FLAO|nr:arginase family protein [Pustulibacterium marinum]SFU46192.1 formiminoglutamase [Pustulibacterium marinum]
MNKLVTYNLPKINSFIRHRKGEVKFGEKVGYVHDNDSLDSQFEVSKASYVLLGIPENIGIKAGLGEKDATFTWNATLKTLLNTQNNKFNKGKKLLILGHLDFSEEAQKVADLDVNSEEGHKAVKQIVDAIDKEVTFWIHKIVGCGKIPIIIGGGQNNAYGIIKGCALAKNMALNVINFDAHSDLLKMNGRHSGNGFSYALKEGFLKRYYIFGLQENHIPKYVLSNIKKNKSNIKYTTFEELFIRYEKGIDFELNKAFEFLKTSAYGLEIDCDAITNFPTDATSMNGFTTREVRKAVAMLSSNENTTYLHISEATPDPENKTELQQVGTFISCLITDFIR